MEPDGFSKAEKMKLFEMKNSLTDLNSRLEMAERPVNLKTDQ